ncbi:penicillin-binding protein PBP2X [Streptococcus loxodontisalivarius]|uniref:Penicillin-binding protein 2X n=1 Tax=Streptococcus loxodontisalivarius TaxID=1349415 RepID=A0ABS2PQX6_9STRE|nr:penicillin-binding protein PBP2X [Streptococcus loxodontisalivarius]MBM7642395.1 penicillin-binding protein 2X [Streptococcus loxodontisalivarius]
MIKYFKRLGDFFMNFVIKNRKTPEENRKHVGQNLMLLAAFIFFIFVINFAIIIGTDSKFGVDLSEGAKSVYSRTVSVQAKRGTIYDRNGNVIAEDSTTYSIYAIIDTSYVNSTGDKLYVQESQYDTVAQIFNEQLGMEKDYVLTQLKTKDVFQVSFGTQGSGLSYSTMSALKEALDNAGIKGVAFETSTSRMYPNGTFASQFIGLAQSQENSDGTKKLVGTTGLEASLNTLLSGTDGSMTYEIDKNGNTLLGTGKVDKAAVNGNDIYTTLDATLQTYLETQMDAFQAQANGVNASATVVNAKTGEILATTQRPTYNSDTQEGLSELSDWTTMLYQSNYEPGSTMKVMLLAAAIDNGTFDANATYTNANGVTVSDTTINDWSINDGSSTGQYMTYAQGFAYSSNVGMTLLEQAMGDSTWSNYLSLYRFGYPTRFGLASESAGFISDNSVNTAMSSFGQGISVTQTQMLRAFTSVSNNGAMLEPQFISQIVDTNNNSKRVASSEVVGNPISADAASQTRDYMVTVGTDPTYGTLYSKTEAAPIIQVGDYSVAVKSGTAQIANENGTGYLSGQYDNIYSVVAMVPSDEPDFIMYVTVQQPEKWSNSYYATVVNPVLEEAMLMKDTLTTTSTVTDNITETSSYKVGNLVGEAPGDVSEELRRNLVHPVVVGTGNEITKVSVKEGTNLDANQQILLLTDKLETLPDMYGWTKENVETFAKWTGITIKYKGSDSGTVTKQNVEAGTAMDSVSKLTITIGD